ARSAKAGIIARMTAIAKVSDMIRSVLGFIFLLPKARLIPGLERSSLGSLAYRRIFPVQVFDCFAYNDSQTILTVELYELTALSVETVLKRGQGRPTLLQVSRSAWSPSCADTKSQPVQHTPMPDQIFHNNCPFSTIGSGHNELAEVSVWQS